MDYIFIICVSKPQGNEWFKDAFSHAPCSDSPSLLYPHYFISSVGFKAGIRNTWSYSLLSHPIYRGECCNQSYVPKIIQPNSGRVRNRIQVKFLVECLAPTRHLVKNGPFLFLVQLFFHDTLLPFSWRNSSS